MFKTTQLIAAVVVALSLTGCTAASEPAAATSPAPSTAPVESAAPATLVPDDGLTTPPIAAGSDADYTREVRLRIKGMTETTDAELIAAGHTACDRYSQGETKDTIDIIKGDAPGEPMPGFNDIVIATWAATVYCSEYAS